MTQPRLESPNNDAWLEQDTSEELLTRAVLRLDGNILGIVLGILMGLIIFVATNWLVIKGGEVVGPHMQLLSQFFIGYSVTFFGSLVGLVYGLVTGYVIGFLTAWIYNRVIALRGK